MIIKYILNYLDLIFTIYYLQINSIKLYLETKPLANFSF